MEVKRFIEKAIEGGWEQKSRHEKMQFINPIMSDGKLELVVIPEAILLDPKAWQAVGKVEGWNGRHKWYPKNIKDWYYKQHGAKAKRCMICQKDNFREGYQNPYTGNYHDGTGVKCPTNTHLYKMHQMIDALAEGNSIEEFIETL